MLLALAALLSVITPLSVKGANGTACDAQSLGRVPTLKGDWVRSISSEDALAEDISSSSCTSHNGHNLM
jgi:hypothetical protein